MNGGGRTLPLWFPLAILGAWLLIGAILSYRSVFLAVIFVCTSVAVHFGTIVHCTLLVRLKQPRHHLSSADMVGCVWVSVPSCSLGRLAESTRPQGDRQRESVAQAV